MSREARSDAFGPPSEERFNERMEKAPEFNGSDYEPVKDKARLSGQIQRVFQCMKDGQWRTLQEIADMTGDPHASISAQLRHLRKPRFGAFDVQKRARGNREQGLFEYRICLPAEQP